MMFKKRVVVLIIYGNNEYRLRSHRIYFWKSKTEYLNNIILEYIDKIEANGIIDIKIY